MTEITAICPVSPALSLESSFGLMNVILFTIFDSNIYLNTRRNAI
jgi:hypothetical protein